MQLGFGCVNLGSTSAAMSPAKQRRLVHAAIDAGVVVFDTADAYGSGTSERLLGRAIRGRRDQVTISTKGGYAFRERTAAEQRARQLVTTIAGGLLARSRATAAVGAQRRTAIAYERQDYSPAYLRQCVESSLRRLQTDHLDVFQLHGPPQPLPGLLDDLRGLLDSGKVGRFGVGAESFRSAQDWAADEHIAVIQLPYGVLDPEPPDGFTDGSRDIELWARGVLGGGVLAAAIHRPDAVDHHPKRETIRALSAIASDAGMGLDELAVRWAVGCRTLDVVLIGMTTTEHLMHNVAIADRGPLPADVQRAIAAIPVPRPGTHPT